MTHIEAPIEIDPLTAGHTVSLSIKGKNHPNEDRLFIHVDDPKVFVIADGVTRTKRPEAPYPDPSGAARAANAIVETAGRFLSRAPVFSTEILVEALRRANNSVMALNVADNIVPGGILDFEYNDYYNACAGLVTIRDNTLHWAAIGDTQIAVFTRSDLPALISENRVSALEQYRDGKYFASRSDRLKFWRQFLRNNTGCDYQTYGTLTGEPAALEYVLTGTRRLSPGELVVLFSDGLASHVLDDEFRRLLRSNPSPDDLQEYIYNFPSLYLERHKRELPNADDDKTIIAFTITDPEE